MTDVALIIRQRAMAEWPEDYAMQKYEIEKQMEASAKMLNICKALDPADDVTRNCIERATTEWHDDYAMQVYEFEKQMEGALSFFNYSNPAVPQTILDGIMQRAFQEWGTDYSMMQYELSNQVEAWLEVHGS